MSEYEGRTVHMGDLTITEDDVVVESLDVHGRAIVKAAGVTFINCIFRGPDETP